MSRKRRKYPVTVESGFPIRHFADDRFHVDIRREGINVRKMFKDLDSARVFCRQQALQLKNQGLSGFSLTERQKLDAHEALHILDRHSSLADAAKFWVRHNRPDAQAITFSDLADRYLMYQELHNRRPSSLRTARDKCRIFALDFGDRPLVTITRQDIEQWLHGKDFSPAYRNIFLRYVKAIFNYAVDEGHIEMNPASRIKAIRVDRTMPEILPVKTVKALFDRAQQEHPRLIPYLAIGFFAGLRPNEIQGLTWKHVQFDSGYIRVLPEVAKTRRARVVEMAPNLKQWLKPYRESAPSTPVAAPYMTLRRWRSKLAKSCGLPSWPADIMRHCFATYHLAAHDIQSTVRQLGHTSPNMLFDHYRGLSTREEAARYWKIQPKRAKPKTGPAPGKAPAHQNPPASPPVFSRKAKTRPAPRKHASVQK